MISLFSVLLVAALVVCALSAGGWGGARRFVLELGLRCPVQVSYGQVASVPRYRRQTVSRQGSALGKVTDTEDKSTRTAGRHRRTQWFDSEWRCFLWEPSLESHLARCVDISTWMSTFRDFSELSPCSEDHHAFKEKGQDAVIILLPLCPPWGTLGDGLTAGFRDLREGFSIPGDPVSLVTEWRFTWCHQWIELCTRIKKVLWDRTVLHGPGWRRRREGWSVTGDAGGFGKGHSGWHRAVPGTGMQREELEIPPPEMHSPGHTTSSYKLGLGEGSEGKSTVALKASLVLSASWRCSVHLSKKMNKSLSIVSYKWIYRKGLHGTTVESHISNVK